MGACVFKAAAETVVAVAAVVVGACAPHGCFRSTVGSSVAQLGRSKHNGGGRKGLTKGACTRWRKRKGNTEAEQKVPYSLP